MKKAKTINQTVSLANPANVSLKVRVLVSVNIDIDTNTKVPMGINFVIRPKMVKTKTAKRCQALMSTPLGGLSDHKTPPATAQSNARICLFDMRKI